MKKIFYFIEFIVIRFFFILCNLLGYRISSNFGFYIGSTFGNIFRTKKSIIQNIEKSKISIDTSKNKFAKNVLGNYGRILAEYPFLKDFRNNNLSKYISIDGIDNLEKIKKNKKPVVFISGHFSNFELMAMQIEKSGINLAAIYRPLNNIFLNKNMEYIRTNFICKNQIKKGRSGTRQILENLKKGNSIALMIDQRVSEGIRVDLFNEKALTTTIPAQFIKKFGAKIIPVHIERINVEKFNITFQDPIKFSKDSNIESITYKLNNILEEMIKKNPSQWIWSHNRWK